MTMSFCRCVAACALALLVFCASPLAAQPLADRVPADAILYFGWQGTDEAGQAYDQSTLKAMLDETKLGQALWDNVKPLLKLAAEKEPGQVEAFVHSFESLAPIAASRPWAVYASGLAVREDRAEPDVRVGFIVDAGEHVDAVRAALEKLQQAADEPDTESSITEEGGVVTLILATKNMAPPAANAGPLGSAPRFKQSLAQMGGPAMAVGYFDVQTLYAFLDTTDAAELETWHRVRKALGLENVQSLTYAAGFEGPAWRSEIFLACPGPHTGIFEVFAGKPLKPETLGLAPKSATWVKAWQMDMTEALKLVRETAQAADPDGEALQNIESGLAVAHMQVGVDIKKQLIDALGSDWVAYSDPTIGAPLGPSITLASHLKDADAVSTALEQIAAFAEAMQQAQGEGGPGLARMKHGDMLVYSVPLGIVSPSLAVHHGNLYVGISPQAVVTADRFATGDGSVLDSPAWAASRKRLPDQAATGAMVADLRAGAPATYQTYSLALQNLSMMFAQQTGTQVQVMLPPLADIMPYLDPAGGVSWVDETGWHSRTVSPFPGSVFLSPEGSTNASSSALGVGILLPALGAARRTARQMQSNTQARGIHQGCVVYAQGAKGKFPPDLATLYHSNYFTIDYLVSPTSRVKVPHGFDTWPKDEQTNWIHKNASYVLVPGLTDDVNTNTIAIFLKPSHGYRDRGTVTYNDNRSVWETDYAKIDRLLQEQTGKTMQQLIDEAEARGTDTGE